ncbi:hypothetical protein I4U23_004250 [Adineta vaga]|nr:hypothetical protein I4U23_004250 [Adineta vaga]
MDETDRCCRQHYDCYKSSSSLCNNVTVDYDFMIPKDLMTCTDNDGTCEYSICLCDKLIAQCLKLHQSTYQGQEFQNLTWKQCQNKSCKIYDIDFTRIFISDVTISTVPGSEKCVPFQQPPKGSTCSKPKWNPCGVIVAGNGTWGKSNVQLHWPSGIFIDQNDNLYVVDEGKEVVSKFVQGSNIGKVVAGGNGRGNASNQFYYPYDVSGNINGDLFIADSSSNRIQKDIDHPTRVFLNKQGDIYVSAEYSGGIIKYSPSTLFNNRSIVAAWSNGGFFVDQCDNIYVCDYSRGTIQLFYNGNNTKSVSVASSLDRPSDVILDQYGNLYITEQYSPRVKRMSIRDKKMEVIAGSIEGKSGNDAEHLSIAYSLAFDSKMNLYVCDRGNHRVQKFEFQGGDLWC